jgi:hypothetical protein
MENFWLRPPAQRLKDWRQFRKHLSELDDDDIVLEELVEWWKTVPISTRVIDPYDSKHWPDPWELLYNDEYDENVIALGMCYTLALIDWPCTLQLIQCNEKNEIKLVLVVDDIYVLNYTYNKIQPVANISHCEILHSWESSELTD